MVLWAYGERSWNNRASMLVQSCPLVSDTLTSPIHVKHFFKSVFPHWAMTLIAFLKATVPTFLVTYPGRLPERIWYSTCFVLHVLFFFPEAPAKVCSMLPNSPFHVIYVTCIYMSYIFHIIYIIYIDSFIYIPLAHTSTASPTSLLQLHPCMVYMNFNHQFHVCHIHHLHQL